MAWPPCTVQVWGALSQLPLFPGPQTALPSLLCPASQSGPSPVAEQMRDTTNPTGDSQESVRKAAFTVIEYRESKGREFIKYH